MYLHLGNDVVIKKSGIIGIYDLDITTVSKHTREFLATHEKNGSLIYVTYELPKSFIVYAEKKKIKVYISQLSCATLIKRCDFPEKISVIQE